MRMMLLAATVMAVAAACHARASDATDWIRRTLVEAKSSSDQCTVEGAAIAGTLDRLGNIQLPEVGKVIVVNIPSGVVTAYEDGVPVIESKAVVGKATTPTPEMDTHVTYVRPNPTWTVPKSIVKRNGWIDKLARDPAFFDDNNFTVLSGGREMSPYDAAEDPGSVDTFVQQPGPGNSLGAIKIGIANDQAIYLHDTNDPGKFGSEVRSASAGCVRLERVTDIAAWIMDVGTDEMQAMVEDGTTSNLTPPENVRVILGYWTAWPDGEGTLRYYPDIYNKDKVCGAAEREAEEGSDDRETEAAHESEPSPGPRFIPQPVPEGTPQWTEYEAR